MPKVVVTFWPDNISIEVEAGENLLDAALAAGVHIDAACGGAGACGRCKIQVQQGSVICDGTGGLTPEEQQRGLNLACRCRTDGDVTLRLPESSRIDKTVIQEGAKRSSSRMTSLMDLDIEKRGWTYQPPASKYYVRLATPTLEDNAGDLTRLMRGLKQEHRLTNFAVDAGVLPDLAAELRRGEWNVTATLTADRSELIRVEAGDATRQHYALALDIGTTTVWGQLIDVPRRSILTTASDYNAQISYGEDVITRIIHAGKTKDGLDRLQQAVARTVNGVIDELLTTAQMERASISFIVAAGNTTMTHLLLGIDPKYIREAPYVPAANIFPAVRGTDIGLHVPESAPLYSLPAVSSYVGGDVIAGVIGSGMFLDPKTTLYIDLGTNGEIVAGNREWLVSASCSAGPAFEGGGIKCGVRAMPGAIADFNIAPQTCEPMIATMNHQKPVGICGVGLIGMLADLMLKGIIEPNGKFRSDLRSSRLRNDNGIAEYVVVRAADSGTGAEIVVTEADIENLMRAKAAMYAGIVTLLEKIDLTVNEIDRVIIAGALGNYLDLEKCIQIGLFPDLPREKFSYIGNGSLLGARLSALSTGALAEAERIAGMMLNVELVNNPRFMDAYMSAMFLPHTDLERFPSVKARLQSIAAAKGGHAPWVV